MTSADRHRKIAALRALAERPGTPAEGETARAMLAKLEARQPDSRGDIFDELREDGCFREDGGNVKFTVDINFDASLFRQAMRDAEAAMFRESVANEFERRQGVYERIIREQEDWHAQQRHEADERQRRDAEEQRQRAAAASAKGQFHTSFADAVDETYRTGETLAEVFQRKKEEWRLSQRLEAWARSHKR